MTLIYREEEIPGTVFSYLKSSVKLPGGLIFSSTFEGALNRERGLFNLAKHIKGSKVSLVPGHYTAFSNNKKIVIILHRELERKVEKFKAHEVGGHAAEENNMNFQPE